METIRTLTADDLPAVWALEMQAFNVAPSDHEPFRDEGGAERFVGAFDGERLVASCEYHRLGQFFGEKPVLIAKMAGLNVDGVCRVGTSPYIALTSDEGDVSEGRQGRQSILLLMAYPQPGAAPSANGGRVD